ncbi:unnamed protein product [Nesidiocoris tenuis]|uniref:Uncharacterized protein n=1 Tax=Nesidiocoris tenuis TaxID=355587 RepID=A0A6H5FXX4_9HEMI|nr:unnamed protein product [Nesidiocoris tenuis]
MADSILSNRWVHSRETPIPSHRFSFWFPRRHNNGCPLGLMFPLFLRRAALRYNNLATADIIRHNG